ncbi:hypothetical protein [Agromyces bauzanensis]
MLQVNGATRGLQFVEETATIGLQESASEKRPAFGEVPAITPKATEIAGRLEESMTGMEAA